MDVNGPVIVVGGGLAGLTAASFIADYGSVELYEKTNHLAGLCANYDVYPNNVFVSEYKNEFEKLSYKPCVFGQHVFHTNSDLAYRVFTKLYDVESYMLYTAIITESSDKHIYWPINSYGLVQYGFTIEEIAQLKQDKHKDKVTVNELAEYFGDNRAEKLIDDIIVPYSKKQWDGWDYAEILDQRVSINLDFLQNTFRDKFECIPIRMDYSKCKLLNNANCKVLYGKVVTLESIKLTYENVKTDNIVFVINTSPIDEFYGVENDEDVSLDYRTCDFVYGYDHSGMYRNMPVRINTPSSKFIHTRIHHHGDILQYEIPRNYNRENHTDIPMYPIKERNINNILKKFNLRCLYTSGGNAYIDIDSVPNVLILHVGRLATYSYKNMDQTVLNSWEATQWIMTHSLDEVKDLPSANDYNIWYDTNISHGRSKVSMVTHGLTYTVEPINKSDWAPFSKRFSGPRTDSEFEVCFMSDYYEDYHDFYSDMSDKLFTNIVSRANERCNLILQREWGTSLEDELYTSWDWCRQDNRDELVAKYRDFKTFNIRTMMEEFFTIYMQHVNKSFIIQPDVVYKGISGVQSFEYVLPCGVDVRCIKTFSHGCLNPERIIVSANRAKDKFEFKLILPTNKESRDSILLDMCEMLGDFAFNHHEVREYARQQYQLNDSKGAEYYKTGIDYRLGILVDFWIKPITELIIQGSKEHLDNPGNDDLKTNMKALVKLCMHIVSSKYNYFDSETDIHMCYDETVNNLIDEYFK